MKLLLTFNVEPDYTTGNMCPYRHLKQFFRDIVPKLIKKEAPPVLFITNQMVKRFTEDILGCIDFFEIDEYNKNKKLSKYSHEAKYRMINRNYDLVEAFNRMRAKLFRADKFVVNRNNGLNNVKVLNKAAYSSGRSQAELCCPDDSTGDAINDRYPKRPEVELTGYIKIKTITLGDVIHNYEGHKPIFSKIDADCDEWDILTGAKKILQGCDERFIVVHNLAKQMEKGCCVCEFCSYLRGKRLRLFCLNENSESLG
jgi:FkbM family methyltransferase